MAKEAWKQKLNLIREHYPQLRRKDNAKLLGILEKIGVEVAPNPHLPVGDVHEMDFFYGAELFDFDELIQVKQNLGDNIDPTTEDPYEVVHMYLLNEDEK